MVDMVDIHGSRVRFSMLDIVDIVYGIYVNGVDFNML